MVKFAAHYSVATFHPVNFFIPKKSPRSAFDKFHGSLFTSIFFCSSSPNHQQCARAKMVSKHNYPPWFSVAPMMDCTDNHYRTLARLITKHAWLYTEMLSAETLVTQKDNLDRFLGFSPEQNPLVLQIGGNNLDSLAKATKLSNAYGYDEINLNCGCPSPQVAGHGCFGVRLMLDPKRVGECMSVIAANTDVPVSVKCRIGIDDHDSYNQLCEFIDKVSSLSPTRHFIIHSRKALLNGISPAENRSIPPLKYEYFYGLLRDFPDLRFTINGGINCVDQILEKYEVYGESVLGKYGRKPNVRDVIKPLLHFFHSESGNGLWKRKADAAFRRCTTIKSFFEETLEAIPDYVLDSPVGGSEPLTGREDLFSNVHNLLPPPYDVARDKVALEA